MHVNPKQGEFRGVTRGLYQSAARMVRGARRSERRRREIRIVHNYFRPDSAWRRAVETACKVHDVDPSVGCVSTREKNDEVYHRMTG